MLETSRNKQSNILIRKLHGIINKEHLTPREFSNRTGLSYSHSNNLLSGFYTPSLDALCRIALAYNISFNDAAYCLVDTESVYTDKDGKNSMFVLVVTNGRGPTAGTIRFLSEEELITYYGEEYQHDRMEEFIKRYLTDYIYKGKYEKAMKKAKEKLDNNLAKDEADTIEVKPAIKEIIELLKDVDEDGLRFIREQIKVYQIIRK